MKEITVEAKTENLDRVTDFVNEELEAWNCPLRTLHVIDIAVDELFGNIANYAYFPKTGPVTVRVEVKKEPLSAVITFFDRGVPFDPLKKTDPDVTLSAEERGIGGLGIYMVKKSMDGVHYEYKDGQNILTVQKNF